MFEMYIGDGAHCSTYSLQMCLKLAGMTDIPEIGMLECMTGLPFGSTFVDGPKVAFLPSPAAVTNPDLGLDRALKTINWDCRTLRMKDGESAIDELGQALHSGAVLLGPVNMGLLPYDPLRVHKGGADHFLVALKIDGDFIRLHDPQGFPFAPISRADLVRAWNAKDFAYVSEPYTLRCNFTPRSTASEGNLLGSILRLAIHLTTEVSNGPAVFGGPWAFARMTDVFRHNPPEYLVRQLIFASLPLAALRSHDGAAFFRELGEAELTKMMVAKGEAFGLLQHHVVRRDWNKVAECFDGLSSLEKRFASALRQVAR